MTYLQILPTWKLFLCTLLGWQTFNLLWQFSVIYTCFNGFLSPRFISRTKWSFPRWLSDPLFSLTIYCLVRIEMMWLLFWSHYDEVIIIVVWCCGTADQDIGEFLVGTGCGRYSLHHHPAYLILGPINLYITVYNIGVRYY